MCQGFLFLPSFLLATTFGSRGGRGRGSKKEGVERRREKDQNTQIMIKKKRKRDIEKKTRNWTSVIKKRKEKKKQRFEDQTKIKQGENIREESGTVQEEAPWHLRAKRTQGQRGHLPTRADLADAFLRRRNRPLLLRSDFACLLLVFDHHLRGFVSLFLWELLDFFIFLFGKS